MKQFFKMMFASTLGVFIAAGLIFLISIFTLIGIVGNMGSSTYIPKSNTVLKIPLHGSIVDNTIENPFAGLLGETETTLSLTSLTEAIKTAKNDKNIKGIYIEAGVLSTGSANIQALRRLLIDFKESGKFIIAYADTYSQSSYYLASVADKIFLNPQGMVEIMGVASQTMFYTGLMEKIGVEMEIFKVGTYKGAVEPFMLDKLSDANREQINSYINSIWSNILNDIAESRNIPTTQINSYADNAYVFSAPEKVVEYGLVDELIYKKEAEEYVKQLSGQSDSKLKTASIDQIKRIKQKRIDSTDKIAILYAEGEITTEASTSLYSSESFITENLADELAKLKDKDDIKAVVLRVNSPGGSAYISEQIWKQVVELKKEKPVVISMGNMAASGGYYISCAANKIVAEKSTLTGSIGVFGTIPNITGTLDKVGITTDMVKTNKYADMGDMSRPFREDERHIMQAYVERTYDLFLTRCADGRNVSKEAIHAIGQGRVWTGEQAIENGLIDELGGIDTAVKIAADLAEISDYSVTEVSGSKDIWDDLLNKQLENLKISVTRDVLGQDFEYIKLIKTLRSASGIQARLPYDIKPL